MIAGAILAASLELTPTQSAQIDAVVEQVMQANHIAGLSVGVGRQGSVLLLRGYGIRDVHAYAFADGDTIYRIGSITKQFTAALVLQEIEAARMQLTMQSHGATVEQLLAQTSGIPNYTQGQASIDRALAAQPEFPPGTQWAYSNTNYYLLGTLLQSASGTTYPALLAEKILNPLHLTASSFVPPAAGDIATGYTWNDGAFDSVPASESSDPSVAFSAAGMSSNARDILAWLEGLRSGKVVTSNNFAAMTTSKTLPDGSRTRYGYGFYIRNWYGWRTAEHSGNVDGFSADDAIVLDDGLEIALLSNADAVSLVPLAKSIVAIVEPAKDKSAVADFTRPAVNEDPSVTAAVKQILQAVQTDTLDRAALSPEFNRSLPQEKLDDQFHLLGPLGPPSQIEFIDRIKKGGQTFEKYRLTFEYQQYWMTLIYSGDGKIDGYSIEPDED